MEDRIKIKDMYNLDYIVSNDGLYPLQKWYNQLVDKTISELNVSDVLRMIRQKELTELAVFKAIELLQDNVFSGEMYDGELLEKLSELNMSSLSAYSDELKQILSCALKESENHEWLCNEEKTEFVDLVNNFSKNINRI